VDDALTGVLELDEESLAEVMNRLVQFGPPRPQAPMVAFSWVPLLRRREVEVHHVDLALPYGPADWPDDFVVTNLDLIAKRVADTHESPVAVLETTTDHGRATSQWNLSEKSGPTLIGDQGELLGWLMGRGTGTSLRMSDGTAIPAPPPWS
jgi:maleylpyruvate isomerase